MINIVFCFCFILNSYSQIRSGEIIYKVKKNPVSFFQKDISNKEVKETLDKIDNIITTIEFNLKFNKFNSLFQMQKKVSLDMLEYHTKMAILFSQGNKIIFSDFKERNILEKTSFLGEDFVIESSMDDLKWNFTKEKKIIENYICYKAFASKEVDSPSGIQKLSFVAWYCPKISFYYGPINISGLPGMVLEFSNNKLIYKAKKITLSEEDVNIESSFNGKVISKKEYESFGKKAFENRDK